MEVNYKKKKYYNTQKYPIRQPKIMTFLLYIVSKVILLFGPKYKIEKFNMEGLKPPYILLSNHMYFIDFELSAIATFPHRVNNVATVDGYYRRPWLMELLGCICKRKFTTDIHLIKSIKRTKQIRKKRMKAARRRRKLLRKRSRKLLKNKFSLKSEGTLNDIGKK